MSADREPERKPSFDGSGLRAVAMLSTAGLTLALSVGIGVGIGVLLDRWLKTNWLVIVFTLLGTAAGFRELIRTVIRANEEQEKADADARRRPASKKEALGRAGVDVDESRSETEER